jgi:hypothetical protein
MATATCTRGQSQDLCHYFPKHKYMEPICGWDYIRYAKDLVVEYHVELDLAGVHYAITAKKADTLTEVMRANN